MRWPTDIKFGTPFVHTANKARQSGHSTGGWTAVHWRFDQPNRLDALSQFMDAVAGTEGYIGDSERT